MIKKVHRIISMILIIVLVIQIAHLENYRYIGEVFATPVEDSTAEDINNSTELPSSEERDAIITEQPTTEQITTEQPITSIQENATTEETVDETTTETVQNYDYISIYDWQDCNVEGGVVETDWTMTSGTIQLMSDVTIKGNLTIQAPLNLNGHSLVVEGDVNLYELLIVNGSITIQGNCNYYSGILSFENGQMDVGGNFSIVNSAKTTMNMIMENTADYLCVSGDLVLDDASVATTNIHAGIIELKGNFIQEIHTDVGLASMKHPDGDFIMDKDSTLLLSGTEPQNIYIAKETTKFQKIVVDTTNVEKDENDQFIFENRWIGFSGLRNYEEYVDNGCPTTYGYMKYEKLPMDGSTLYIYGSCYYVGEPLHLEGKTVRIVGDFIQDAGIHMEGWNLYVYGDYRIQSLDENGDYGETEGYIDLSDGGYIYVFDDFYTESIVDHTGLLTDGQLRVSYNLHQIGKENKNLVVSGSALIIMGTYNQVGKVTVVMDNPLGNPIRRMDTSGSVDFHFENGACITENLNASYSGFLYYTPEVAYYSGDVIILPEYNTLRYLRSTGNVTILDDLELTYEMRVDGNIIIENGCLEMIDHVWIYAKDIIFTENKDNSLLMSGNSPVIQCENIEYAGTGEIRLKNEYAKINCENFTCKGDGSLIMEGTYCSIECNDFYYACNSENTTFVTGTIYFSGDFYVEDIGTPNSFVCSENHKVYAKGSNRVQHITIENPASCIETLEVSNGIGGTTVCTEGTVVHNIIDSSHSYAWEGVEGYTLEQDEVYNEDFVLYGGTLDLNGHTLTVNGDLVASAGTIDINGGHLIVNGDMNLAYRDCSNSEPEFYESAVDIVMDQEQDQIDISGDWYCNFDSHSLKNMTNGTVTLQGNMNIDGTFSSSTYRPVTYNIMSGTNLHLTGTEKQTITGVSTQIKLDVGDLIVGNESELVVELPTAVNGTLQLPESLSYSFYSMNIQDLGKITNGSYVGNITVGKSTFVRDVKVDGKLVIEDTTDLCGYTLEADEISINGAVTLSKGKIKTGTLYMYNDKIYMLQPEDVIETDYMYVSVFGNRSDYMTDGNIYITESFYDRTEERFAFLPTGNHTITFTKTDIPSDNPVEIYFENASSLLNKVVLADKLNKYEINREKEEIAKELILSYEDIEQPAYPGNMTATAIGCYHVNLSWDEATDNMEVYRYKIYRDGKYITRVSGTVYTDAVLSPNTTYRYTVSVIDAKGNESEQSPILEVTTAQDTTEPYYNKKPTVNSDEDYLKMYLEDRFLDKDGYVDYYIIKKNGEEVARVLEDATMSYRDVNNKIVTHSVRTSMPIYEEYGLEYGVTYEYGITAVDAEGNASEEYIIEVVPNYPPKKPEGFTVTSENGFNIISFQMSGTNDIKSYGLYRNGSYLATITNTEKEIYSYIDKNVTVGTKYTYKMRAYNTYGTSGEYTDPLKITTIAEVTPPQIRSVGYTNSSDYVNEDLDVQITVTDESALASIYAYIVKSGEEEQQEIYRQNINNYSKNAYAHYTFNIKGLKGEYELHTVVVDHCGNETETVKICKINMGGLPVVEVTDTAASASAVYMEWNAVEGAAYYIVEQNIGSVYKKIHRTSDLQARIENLYCDTEYPFRVVAYDKEGVRGLSMEDITITTSSDITAPEIKNVHGNDTVLGSKANLYVIYSDDVQVENIYTYYRVKGGTDWNLIQETSTSNRSGTSNIPWDKTGLVSGEYEVRYQLEDSSGNQSEEVIKTYYLDLAGPSIQNFRLTPKDWAIELSWDEITDSDYTRYELKRITASDYDIATENGSNPFQYARIIVNGTDEHRFEEQISPKQEYVYQLSAYDTNGNVTTAIARGTSIDNDVIAPAVGAMQPMFAAQNIALSLSAQNCSDNDGIVSYQWNMGNGDIVYGEKIEYVYQEPGTYTMTLTVIDNNGNTASTDTRVTVGKDIGTLKVHVTSAGKNVPDADVVVCINEDACKSGADSQTDSQGILTVPMMEGTYKIAAYKDGYLPKEMEVTVEIGKVTEVNIELEKGEMIESTFTTKEMTKEEMEEAGIDTTTNQQCFEYTIELIYSKDKIEKLVFNSTQSSGSYSTPSYSDSNKESKITVQNVSDDPSQPLFVITKTTQVSISWLQNIYQVDFTISNQADEQFYLEDAKAAIDLSGGLVLATMQKSDKNSQQWEIGTLNGGESKTHTWYVTANEAGSYPLKVDLEATMQPFNKEINKTLESKDDLVVEVGIGLHLYIYPEKDAYIGEQYYIQYKLVNESNQTYHNVTTSFGGFETTSAVAKVIAVFGEGEDETSYTVSADTGANYYVKDESAKEANITLETNDRMTIETLNAGETVYGTYRFQFNAEGDINREYYKLMNQYVEELNANNTNVTVTMEAIPGHLTKKVVELRFSTNGSNNHYTPLGKTRSKDNKDTVPTSDEKSAADWDAQMPNSTEEVKDPINLMTGAFTVNHVVAAVSGANTLSFDLAYNSLYTETIGELGKGWYHNYEMRIEQNGSLIILYQNPYEMLYFSEDEKTKYAVCGTIENDTIVVSSEDTIKRTYYQTGSNSKQNKIVKNQDGYILYVGQEQYTFDSNGVLNGYVSENGVKTSIIRTKDSLVIEDVATSKKITASYDEEGRIVSVKDAAGGETTFEYENNCMTVLKGKSGTKLIYQYDENGRILVGKEGDETVYVENTFDNQGRVLTQVANGKKDEITTFSYEENTEDETTTVTMTNADGTTEQAVSDKYGQGIQYVDAIGGVKNYTYNEYHEMTAYRYSNGTGADYSYDSNGNISKVAETTGRTTDYTYDSKNRVIRMVCNDGTDVAYTYNENGQVATMTSGTGLSATYTYNENGQVLTETSSLGTIEYTYEKGMLRCLKDYSDNYHYVTYDDNGNVVQYIDGAGVVTNYKVNASGRVEEEAVTMEDGTVAATKYTYDSYGNITSKTDAKNNTTQYVYDEEDRLSKEIRPDGTYYQYSYDQNGNVTKIVCPDGVTTAESVYDAAGNALSLTDTLKNVQKAGYSVGGQLLTMTQANGGEVRFTYYENGLLESQTDANDNTTTLTYDEAGRISTVIDASGNSTIFGYDKDGNLSTVENALGNSVTMEYNQYRKVASQTDANGNVTRYEYDKALNCTKVIDAEGGITEFAYDTRGQITSMTKKGDTEEQDVTLSMSYDNLGNVTSLTDGEGNTQRMEYDSVGNVIAVYDAYGVKTESYEYDSLGNCTKVTDAFGHVTTNSYDALGNLVGQLNESTGNAVSYSYIGGKYLASSKDSLDRTASMTYDSMGNVETLTNPNGGVTSYQYDLNNNLTDEIIGEDYHVRYTYNAQNLVASKTNSRDQQTTYSYDALGRIIKQEDEAGIIEYTYDSNDNILTVTETVGDQVNVITRTYDGLNRVKTYEDAKGNTIQYSYDKIGNLTKLTYPNGKVVTYTYNRNCSISSVTDWSGRTTTYDYDKNGRLIETKRPNGTIEKREYDKAGQLTLILDMSGDKVVNRQEYSYDASGNITSVKQLYSGELNFTEVQNTEMTYDKNNRLLTYNGEQVKYDKDGNMIYGPLNGVMAEFKFDCRNRLIQAGDTTYEYDAENNRVAVTTGTKRTEYVVNSQPELSQVLQANTVNGDNTETTYYYYGKGLLAQENSKGYLTYHFNNVGSTMAITDKDGNISAKYNYSPYGELIQGEYDDNIQFLYNGQFGVTTDGNGLYYMRARYYNVDIKRFINQDVLTGTLERISSLNRYSYVEGNPISYLDPFGLEPYDTTDMHGCATVFSLIGFVLGLFPTTKPVGTIISVGASGFDFGLYIYDSIYDIRDGNIEDLLLNINNMIIDLIGILTTGISNGYFKSAQMMESYGGLMDGYIYELGRLYDEWSHADEVISNADFLYQLSGFIDYLRGKIK